MSNKMENIVSRLKLENRVSNKIIIYSLFVLILTILLNLKPSVNTEITILYYYIAVLCMFVFYFLYYYGIHKFNNLKGKNIGHSIFDMFLVFVITFTLFQSFLVFGYFRAVVDPTNGESMLPTLEPNQSIIVRTTNNVDNFDIVVVVYDEELNFGLGLLDGDLLVKRVIAKGGDRFNFKNGTLYLNGKIYTERYVNSVTKDLSEKIKTYDGISYDAINDCYVVEEGYYFVMGDNRGSSTDSRALGLFTEEQIVGKVVYELHSLFEWEKVQ